MTSIQYIDGLQAILEQIKREQAGQSKEPTAVVDDALAAGGIVHHFGTAIHNLIADGSIFVAPAASPPSSCARRAF